MNFVAFKQRGKSGRYGYGKGWGNAKTEGGKCILKRWVGLYQIFSLLS